MTKHTPTPLLCLNPACGNDRVPGTDWCHECGDGTPWECVTNPYMQGQPVIVRDAEERVLFGFNAEPDQQLGGRLTCRVPHERGERIVRAVNNHDALVAALRAVVGRFDVLSPSRPHALDCPIDPPPGRGDKCACGWDAFEAEDIEQARAALRAAGEEV